jgi:hypothetical protein
VLVSHVIVLASHFMASNPIPFDQPTGLVTIPRRLWQRLAECHLNSRAKGILRTWLVHGFPTF